MTSLRGILAPGGWAPDKLRRDAQVLDRVRTVHAAGGLVATICHGPWILISAGILRGRPLTSTVGIRDDVVNAGATWVDEPMRDRRQHRERTRAEGPAGIRCGDAGGTGALGVSGCNGPRWRPDIVSASLPSIHVAPHEAQRLDPSVWATAPTLDEFVRMPIENAELWRTTTRLARLSPDAAARAGALASPARLLVLLEDWCGDAMYSVPFVQRIVDANPRLSMRVLRRDEHETLMASHLSGTARSIPVVMLFDALGGNARGGARALHRCRNGCCVTGSRWTSRFDTKVCAPGMPAIAAPQPPTSCSR